MTRPETSSEKTLTPLRGQRTDAIPAENMLKEGKFKTRTLDLQESLELQKEQATRLKKTQLDQAATRLKERLKIGGEQQSDPVQLTKEQLMAYRTPTAKGILLTTHCCLSRRKFPLDWVQDNDAISVVRWRKY